ncbi:hypothetical protein FBR43_07375 [Sphingomonas baiyangensis]|uniref:Uncharacterized protein n=1 Tax=Sphingomonas baiyangensis TaxID=2572576 RepID=A0A4U1L3D5_9SPHN|nr:hypothetical protein FBR43_07375 [Sphingomonas baiyangensis]
MSKRRHLDGTALNAALRAQHQRDATEEPASLLTTMDAVRLLKPLILDRRTRKWTDPMIAALLAELGVEISAETLRTYRSRLAREASADEPAVAPSGPAAPAEMPAPATRSATPLPSDSSAPVIATSAPSSSLTPPPVKAAADAETGATPRRFNAAVDLDDCVCKPQVEVRW